MALAAGRMSLARAGDLAADVAAAKAGKTKYDGHQARVCLDALASASCNGFLPTIESVGPACLGIFSGGNTSNGEPCISQSQCRAGSYCMISSPDLCTGTCAPTTSCAFGPPCPKGQVCDLNQGTCVAAIPAAATGEPCGNQEHACQSGLYCAFSMPFDLCMPLGKEGEGCGEVWGCAAGLICTPSDPTTKMGVCRRVAAKGEPCQAVNQCGGFEASSITCDMTLRVCVDNTSDGPCFTGPPAASGCNPFTSYCDASTLMCKPIATIGGSCTVADAGNCGLWTDCQSDPNDSTGTNGFCTAYPVCTP
jgi:hypothetical protein